jgi:uncharacterized protein involved in type VI secretion and phage assembly
MADIDLLALLQGRLRTLEDTRPQVGGVTLGIVTDTNDELGLGRVKVTMPWLSESVESAWARIAVPWAGQGMGSYFLPEVDDQVLLSFRHGDLSNPYVVGFLWSATSPPPEPSPRLGQRELRSKTGHKLQFDDLDGHRAVTLHSSSGHKVTLDDRKEGPRVRVENSSGALSITLEVNSKTISIVAKGEGGRIELSAPGQGGSISLDAENIDIHARQSASLNAHSGVTISGKPVRIN